MHRLFFLLAGLCLGARVHAAQPVPIVLLTDDTHPPYLFADASGTAQGPYAELVRRLATELPGYAIELRPSPWKRAVEAVRAGQADGMLAPFRRPELRPWMRYSEPLLRETTVVVCRRDVAARVQGAAWPEGYAGLRFGNSTGYLLAGKAFFDMAAAGRIRLEETKGTGSNLQKLQAGRIDCYPDDRDAIRSEARRLGIGDGTFVETTVIGVEYGYVGYGSAEATGSPQREAFIAALDGAIRRLRAAGELPAVEASLGTMEASAGMVLLVDADNAPYTFAGPGGQAQGVYVEQLKEIVAGLPFPVELRPAPWTRALRDVEDGRADGVFASYRKPGMRPWMRYSEPLFVQTTVVLCRRGVDQRLREAPWPAGFAGLRIGNIDGFVPVGRELFDMAREGKLVIEETRTLENTLRKLAAGRIDCYPGERGAVAEVERSAGLDPADIVEMQTIAEERVYIGYGSEAQTWSPRREQFIHALDEAIRAARAAGRLPDLSAAAPD